MKIISLKLTTSEEVVAELVKENSTILGGTTTSYTLRRPHILQYQPIAPGKLGLAFVPWALSNPDIETIDIPLSAVISAFDPSSAVEKQYIQQTSSIQIASTL